MLGHLVVYICSAPGLPSGAEAAGARLTGYSRSPAGLVQCLFGPTPFLVQIACQLSFFANLSWDAKADVVETSMPQIRARTSRDSSEHSPTFLGESYSVSWHTNREDRHCMADAGGGEARTGLCANEVLLNARGGKKGSGLDIPRRANASGGGPSGPPPLEESFINVASELCQRFGHQQVGRHLLHWYLFYQHLFSTGTCSISSTSISSTGTCSTGISSTGICSTGISSTGICSTGISSTGICSTGISC